MAALKCGQEPWYVGAPGCRWKTTTRRPSACAIRQVPRASTTTVPAGTAGEQRRGKLLIAACALIDADNRILLSAARRQDARRAVEFPGGKVEAGKAPEECLVRELEEELGIVTKVACLAPLTFASHAYPQFHLLMPLYVCRRYEGIPTGREGQEIKWVRVRDLRDYPMPPADEPLIPILADLL
ncbi:MAG: (deoxy)nucleoside triphosphate pyrophosphohydrolase [Brucellaceae bacterium]|nr:(deoxy)nucleoside triphosphate pyrophosphohydrolase [Brucellaceae bacterium]